MDNNILMVGDFKTQLSIMVRTSRQKIKNEAINLNTINQMNLTETENIPPKSRRIYILLMYTWNILQER
jgi:hypothetical protein